MQGRTGAFAEQMQEWHLWAFSDRLATVRSGKKRSSLEFEMETGKKTGLYGLGPLDRSPVQSLENWDRTAKVGIAIPSDLEPISVTLRQYS